MCILIFDRMARTKLPKGGRGSWLDPPRLVKMYMRLAITLSTLGGCQGRPDPTRETSPPYRIVGKSPPPHPDLGITVDNYPKVDGSTSTQPLQTMVACKVLGANFKWERSGGDGSRELWARNIYEPIPGKFHAEDTPLTNYINVKFVKHNGTSEAYANLINKRV